MYTHTRYVVELISNLPIDGTTIFMEAIDFQHLMMFVFHHLNVLGIFCSHFMQKIKCSELINII